MLNTQRISSALDVPALSAKRIVAVGNGGGSFLVRQLARCGLRRFKLIDPDVVTAENLCRQVYTQRDLGQPKVEATRRALEAINPSVEVETFACDVTNLTDDQQHDIFSDIDIVLGLTDNHAAQSASSRLALAFRAAFIAVGIYPGGVGGEAFWMRRGGQPCYRCMVPHRFERQAAANAVGRSLDPPSDGATIFVGALIDSIAGELALALLTEGADNRYGRFLSRLGNRQLLVLKVDPDWETSPGRDIVRDDLGIAADNPFYCTYNTIAMAPSPEAVATPCVDCRAVRDYQRDAVPPAAASVVSI